MTCGRCGRSGSRNFTVDASGAVCCRASYACLRRRDRRMSPRPHVLVGVERTSAGWVGLCACGGWDLSEWPAPSLSRVRAAHHDHRLLTAPIL